MKVMQVFKGQVYYDLSFKFENASQASKFYASDILIVDTPDYVFPGWGYDASKEGDDRFIKPVAPEGFAYDDETGTLWNPELSRSNEREAKHAETTNDTLQALRKIREGDKTIDWEAWLSTLDAYNVAIEETKNQESYPLKVTYPEYPTKPTE